MKRTATLLLTALMIFTSACGKIDTEDLPPLPVITEAPVIIDDSPADPVSTPPQPEEEKPEPEYETGPAVFFNGEELPSGSFMVNDAVYVSFDEMAQSLAIDAQQPDMNNPWSFVFHGSACTLTAFETAASRDGESVELSDGVIWWHGGAYVGVESMCSLLGISVYTDGDGKIYCTPGAFERSIAEGYRVPVLLYHAVSDNIWGTEKYFVSPKQLDEQLAWLVEEGYEPIWFSDLADIESYEKPVILTFDDGYEDNYTTVLPLLQKYGVKATVFVITGYSLGGNEYYLTPEHITELSRSGLVEIQSNTVSHASFTSISAEERENELRQSKEDITKLTGKEPYVLAYPNGARNSETDEAVKAFYRFAVTTEPFEYVTGANECTIGRYFVLRGSSVEQLKALLY